MKAMPAFSAAVFLLAWTSPAIAAPLCVGKADISGARIAGVENNGGLTLSDGRVVKLEGVRLAPPSMEMLRQTTAVHTADLHAGNPRQDRYGRIRAQLVLSDGAWLQQTLLEQGLARVELAPDNAACAVELYAAEAKARASRAGLWKLPVNTVRGVTLAKADTGTFQIVEGEVLSVDIRSGRAYLNFGTDYKTDFTITISPEDRKAYWGKMNPRDYLGKTMRVRGIVQYYNGPELEVAAPHQIEIVQ